MIKRLLLIVALGVSISGCFMAPLALIGPATSGFSTASIIQSGVSTGASYVVKKSTGKTISEHVINAINSNTVKQSYIPIYSSIPYSLKKHQNLVHGQEILLLMRGGSLFLLFQE